MLNNSINKKYLRFSEELSLLEAKNIATGKFYKKKIAIHQRIRLFIGQKVKGTIPQPDYKYFWPNAIIIDGLIDIYKITNDNTIFSTLEKFGKQAIKASKKHICYSDEVTLGNLLIFLHIKTGEIFYLEMIEKYKAFLLKESFKNNKKIIPYRTFNSNIALIDTIGLTCPFLINYGILKNDESSIDLAINQIEKFIEYGFDSKSDLPFHGYNLDTREKLGDLGWGRGVGWMMYGIAKSIKLLEDRKDKSFYRLIEILNSLSKTVQKYQNDSGYFEWILSHKKEPIDTSTTALIGYSLAILSESNKKNDRIKKSSIECLEAIIKSKKPNGKIYDCSSECEGLGLPPKDFSSYPWCHGPTLSLCAALLKNNID